MTVQAPQPPSPQPSFVPVKPMSVTPIKKKEKKKGKRIESDTS